MVEAPVSAATKRLEEARVQLEDILEDTKHVDLGGTIEETDKFLEVLSCSKLIVEAVEGFFRGGVAEGILEKRIK